MPDALEEQDVAGPPPWDRVARQFQAAFPEFDQQAIRRMYEDARNLRIARERVRDWTPGTADTLIQGVPIGGTVYNTAIGVMYGRAANRIREGRPEPGDYDAVARYERMQELAGNRNVEQTLTHLGLDLTRIAGEGYFGGRILGAASEIPYLGAPLRALGIGAEVAPLGTATVGPTAGQVAGAGARWLGRTALETASMPSMYMEGAVQRNIDANRDPLDLRGLPPAFAVGMMQVAILNSLGNQMRSAFPGEGVGDTLRRLGYAGPIGLVEQQIADTVAITANLQSGYGVLGDAFSDTGHAMGLGTPARPGAWQHMVSSLVAFTAFAAMHEPTYRQARFRERLMEEFASEARRLAEAGVPREQAAERLMERLNQRIENFGPYEQRGRAVTEDRPSIEERRQEAAEPRVEPLSQPLTQEAGPLGQPGMPRVVALGSPIGERGIEPGRPAERPLGMPETPIEARPPLGRPEAIEPRIADQASIPERTVARAAEVEQLRSDAATAAKAALEAKAAAEVAANPKAETPKAESAPSAEQRTLRDLWELHLAGEATSRDEINRIANLTAKEAHVLWNRLEGRSLQDIAKDPEMANKKGQAVSREWARQVERKALDKFGLGESVDKAIAAAEKARNAIDAIEAGQRVEMKELRFTPEEFEPKVKQRLSEREIIEQKLDALTAEFVKESERGPISAERRAAYDREIARITGRSEGGKRPQDAPPSSFPGSTRPAESPRPAEAATAEPAKAERLTPERFEAEIERVAKQWEAGEQTPERALQSFAEIKDLFERAGIPLERIPDILGRLTPKEIADANRELARAGEKPLTAEDHRQIVQDARAASEPAKPLESQPRPVESAEPTSPAEPAGRTEPGSVDAVERRIAGEISAKEKEAKKYKPTPVEELAIKLVDEIVPKVGLSEDSPKLEKPFKSIRQAISRWAAVWRELAGEQFPRSTSMSPEAGSAMVEHASQGLHVQKAQEYFKELLLRGVKPVDYVRYGAAFIEHFRLRYAEQMLSEAAGKLYERAETETNQIRKDAMLQRAEELSHRSADMPTLIGREGSGLATQADLKRTLEEPAFKKMLELWEKEFGPWMDEFFRKAQQIDPTAPIEALTQYPGLPISLKAVEHTTTPEPGAVMFQRTGDLTAPRQRRLGAAREFTGMAEGYVVNLPEIIDYTIRDRVKVATQAEMYRALQESGLAIRGERGLRFEGYRELKDVWPKTESPSLYIKEEAYSEVRRALNTDDATVAGVPVKVGRLPFSDMLNKINVTMSMTEAASHGLNLVKHLFEPKVNPIDTARNFYKLVNKDLEILKEVRELARMGAMKPEGWETSDSSVIAKLMHAGGMKNPINWARRFLDLADQATRLTMKHTVEELQRRGDVPPGEEHVRNAVNAVSGNYNKLTQHWIVRFLRETGLGPFATAGTTFNVSAIRNMLGEPVYRTTTWEAYARLRAEKMLRIMAVLAVVPITNYLMWGRWDGDDNTPIGSIKLGSAPDGKTTYLDLAGFTGVSRGARLTGLMALLEGHRYGATSGEIGDRARRDAMFAWSHPAEGPIVQFAHTLATGENLVGMKVAKQAWEGESQTWQNFLAAMWNMNPPFAALSGAGTPERRPTTWHPGSESTIAERLYTAGGLGAFGVRSRKSPPGRPLGRGH